MRNHEPIVIEEFNGLWARGGYDEVPPDHFTDCNNIDYLQSSVQTRNRFAEFAIGPGVILRSYIYQTTIATVPTTFILALATNFHLYSIKISPVIAAAVDLMTFTSDGNALDFAYVNINGRAYISPSNRVVGLTGVAAPARDILMVYDGTNIYPAASRPLTLGGPIVAANSATAGSIEAGLHYFAAVGETATGYITGYKNDLVSALVPGVFTATGGFKADLSVVPRNGGIFDPPIVKRHIIATKVVPPSYVGSSFDLQFFFVPNGTINDDTTTTITVDFFDNQLIDDATYLLDQLYEIPAGVMLSTYHSRLVIGGVASAPSTAYISRIGEPESIDSVDGLLPIDVPHSTSIVNSAGASVVTGISAFQEYRDVGYTWKFNRTYAMNDNGDVPANWSIIVLDEGIGSFVHGIIPVLDSAGINIDYILVTDKTGLYIFDGLYRKPEVTWKIADLWKNVSKVYDTVNALRGAMHYCNDTVNKKIYICLSFDSTDLQPDEILLIDYANVDPANAEFYTQVKFARWRFSGSFQPTSILLYDTGNAVKLLAADVLSADFYEYNGSSATKETVVAPYVQTYLMGDKEGNILHFGAVRARIIGNGVLSVLTPSLIASDLITATTLPIINSPASSTGVQPTVLANLVSQKAMLKVTAVDNGYFNISNLIVFVKALWSSFPS